MKLNLIPRFENALVRIEADRFGFVTDIKTVGIKLPNGFVSSFTNKFYTDVANFFSIRDYSYGWTVVSHTYDNGQITLWMTRKLDTIRVRLSNFLVTEITGDACQEELAALFQQAQGKTLEAKNLDHFIDAHWSRVIESGSNIDTQIFKNSVVYFSRVAI